ncbi:MAG: hypothetical protein Q9222_007743 [Ikaeria aurantiellina]
MAIDYSVYFVTDSTPALLGNKKLEDVVSEAVQGGATVVQYREKHGETTEMIEMAKNLGEICQAHNVPLIINDRVDIAKAVAAHGVHLGQTDGDPVSARQALGPDAIIGVTVSSPAEAVRAVEAGADYLGIGTVYATPTKTDTKDIIGTTGVRDILDRISTIGKTVPTVAIGGINARNIQRVLFKSQGLEKKLDGAAVVSAIAAAEDVRVAARELRRLALGPPSFITRPRQSSGFIRLADDLLSRVNGVIRDLGQKRPLCHNMTNLVVQNFAANVALAM